MALTFVRYADGGAFLKATEEFLLRNEAENGLTIGVAGTTQRDSGADALWSSVSEAGQVVATALETPPYKAVLTSGPDEAIDLLATEIHGAGLGLPGVFGPSRTALRFAEAWSVLTGVAHRIETRQRIYRLDRVIPSASTAGEMRAARPDETELLAGWMDAYIEDLGTPNPMSGRKIAEAGIDSGAMFVWDDGGPVSTASWTRPAAHGVTIERVYTPGSHRSQGYASACVAALSQKMLDEGRKFCALYTDRSNRTANDIYMSIGYKPVCDADAYLFE
ncbi:MAG: GNAT family N-acetyltransferase [Chloroflexi bacterium]|nr:GNAT family N-acetyltransferase [Chloroflexota bacterium]